LLANKYSPVEKLKIGAFSVARLGSITYVTEVKTGKIDQYPSRRKAALVLNIAPLTLKKYIGSMKLYDGRYKITE
jgi:hypothetical protein